ncbi:reverse transcriptase domain-containing protein [Tanacetum coccineum]
MITMVQSAVKIVIQQHEQAVQKKQEEQAAFTPYWKFPIFDDDDDDDTIPETESDELIKSSVKNLVPIPSESEDSSDIETDFDPEEEIRLVEKLLYDNSSPRPLKEFNSKNSDALIESFSPSPITVKDSDSLMEEIDLFLTPDDSMELSPPSNIEHKTCLSIHENEYALLRDRSTTSPSGIGEDVFVKVGKFHFPADFVVVDYVVDPRVPLILGRPFLRTARTLIDVYGEELTLRVDDEAITFKVGQTLRYSYNDALSINRIDVIDVACDEYAQEVLGFSDSSTSGNPTPSLDPILSTSSPSLIPFKEGDFILEEIEAYLTNDSFPLGFNDDDFDSEGELLLLEKLLNDDPSSPLPLKEFHVEELKIVKSSINDPLELKLKDLPSHLEEDVKGTRLLKVLKYTKRAIAWKMLRYKGIDPQFCTHKILMEDDSKPAIQHQRRVNPKIHEVIKKEVIKLLDAGLIYPIFDSPWVSPVHCVPKKGGITIIENDDNELIPTRLVTGWRVCIDYRKLNDATRKDHFPLPFMDQMLERLARNEYYCFLDGFSGYFQIPIDRIKDKRRPPSLALMGRLPTDVCLSTYVMLRARSKDKMLKRREDTNLVLNWEKCHFMVKEGIVLGHKDFKVRIEVDKAKVDVIAKLPHRLPSKASEVF